MPSLSPGAWLTRALTAAVLAAAAPGASRATTTAAVDLTNLSLDELARVEVTIVSRNPEAAGAAAAAVTVITNEDVRRSGATSLPEAFRLAPGLHVGRGSSSAWAVSSRGFGSLNSSKLLVLIDGRSVYTPLFSGVFWDVQDTLLEDLDRIEIIRGPGASIWGAGAMNGVINVITRSARETHGTHIEGGGGTYERGFAGLRQGGQLGEKVHYRVFGKFFDRDAGFGTPDGQDDRWRMGRGGLRIDADPGKSDALTLQGEAYVGEVHQVRPSLMLTGRPPPMGRLQADVAGGHVLASWTHRFSPGADLTLRAYYDRTRREDPTFKDDLHTMDVDLASRLALSAANELVWGLSYRQMRNHFRDGSIIEIRPPRATDHQVSGFIQDTASLHDDDLRITAGTKLEHNEFSGFEIEPSLRFAVDLPDRQTLWAAVSRPVRIPTRFERDIYGEIVVPSPSPRIELVGSRDLRSEKLIAGELGHRWQPNPRLQIEQAGFVYRYSSLITFEPGMAFSDAGQNVQPITYLNAMHGTSFGGELVLTWTPLTALTLGGSYSYAFVDLVPEALDINRDQAQERAAPRHQLALRSELDLPGGWSLSAYLRWMDKILIRTMPLRQVDGYATADVRLAWRRWSWLELSVVGQSLLQDHHFEFPDDTEVERSVYGKAVLSF